MKFSCVVGRRQIWRSLFLGSALLGTLVSAAGASSNDPYAALSRNVLAPGSIDTVPAGKHSTDQISLYDGLTPLGGDVTTADVDKYFKPGGFESRTMAGSVEATGHKGLRIVRDSYGVPHVFGKERKDTMFGAGWVTAHDRGLLINVLRQSGRLAALEVPYFNPKDLTAATSGFTPSKATEAKIAAQLDRLRKLRGGRTVESDLESYVDGINAYFRKKGEKIAPWTVNDVVACSALVGALFGSNGGNEVRNSAFLDELYTKFGPKTGKSIWSDLTRTADPESPATIQGNFPYGRVPTGNTGGSLVVDAGSFDQAATSTARASAARTAHMMSNALVIGKERSTTGHPMAVMGPQAGYIYPAVVMEMDLHGGGIDARGISFAGSGPYVMIGRGKDFAWSATTSEGDTEDQYLEQLCDPSGGKPTRNSHHYKYLGRCTPMQRFVVGTYASGDAKESSYWRTMHGPVGGTVTVKGRPYAVTTKRSTSGREVLNGIPLSELNEGAVRSASGFVKTMLKSEMTLNWFYVDSNDIGYASAGRYPRKPAEVNPGLPTKGDGRYEWEGFLSPDEHPQAINPKSGAFINWNNQPAPGFSGSDSSFSYSSVHRVDLLDHLKPKSSMADLVSVMNAAATTDLRAIEIWPTIRRVLGSSSNAPDARSAAAADQLDQWVAAGAGRLDRDSDGKVDAPGAAVIDKSWIKISDAVMGEVLGDKLASFKQIGTIDDYPSDGGSTFESGWYGLIKKDLRSALGDKVIGPYSRVYCGAGVLSRCRVALWAAIKQATDELATTQGDDPTKWQVSAETERIKFAPGLIPNTMRWTNRPTFQQLIEFKGHRSGEK